MRALIIAVLILMACESTAQDKPPVIQILIDDSGVLLDADHAQHYKLLFLSHIRSLAARRATSKIPIDVISTSLGRTIWSGTPMTIRRYPDRAQNLVEAIKSEDTRCNNLPGAFKELRSNVQQLERSGVDEVHVIVFSSLIDTPRPCPENLKITLPQTPPVDGDIVGVLTGSPSIRSIAFYWISPHQKRVWEEFLQPVFNHAKTTGLQIEFLDVERSKPALQTSPFSFGEER